MHGKSKIYLDASKTSSRKIQLWIHRIENGRISAFSELNIFAEEVEINFCCFCQIFLEHLITPHQDG